MVKGQRVYDVKPQLMKPGQFGFWEGTFYAVTTKPSLLANLSGFEISELSDGSISVSPSIMVRGAGNLCWHGYLKNGEWNPIESECCNKI